MTPGEQAWSPYPVQDWTTLPYDPLGTDVDPGWPPPVGRPGGPGRRWVPLVTFGLLAVLIVTAAAWGLRVDPGPSGIAVARFLPEDGVASYAHATQVRGGVTTDLDTVTESARLSGTPALLSADSAFVNQILGAVTTNPASVQAWRTTTTELAPVGAETPFRQTTSLYEITTSGVTLLGTSSPDAAVVYGSGLLELPADVAAGRTWSSDGTTVGRLGYHAEFRAEALPGSCLRVTGALRYLPADGQPAGTEQRVRDWCPGRGVVASSDSTAGRTVASRTTNTPALGPLPTTDRAVSWSGPAAWPRSAETTLSVEPTLGQAPMSGVTAASVAPVRTTSGLVVRALSSPGDLVATAPRRAGAWSSVWRAHPGGSVLSLRAFGNAIVVATSDRRLLGYDARGVRRWSLSLAELAPAPPVRLSADQLVLADLSGAVRAVNASTGAVAWTTSVDADVAVTPAVGAGLVLVMDRGGTTSALDAATGERRWHTNLEGSGAAVVGDTVVVLQDQTAHGLDPATGQTRWLRPFSGTLTTVTPFGDRLVVATKSTSVLLDAGGRVVGRYAAWLSTTVTADHLVGWGTDAGELVGRDGQVQATWALPPTSIAFEDRPGVALDRGVLLFGNDWNFQEWGDDG